MRNDGPLWFLLTIHSQYATLELITSKQNNMNKYIVELRDNVYGRVVIKAKNKRQAQEVAEKYLAKHSNNPVWWEWGSESAVKIDRVTTKKQEKIIKEEILPLVK